MINLVKLKEKNSTNYPKLDKVVVFKVLKKVETETVVTKTNLLEILPLPTNLRIRL